MRCTGYCRLHLLPTWRYHAANILHGFGLERSVWSSIWKDKSEMPSRWRLRSPEVKWYPANCYCLHAASFMSLSHLPWIFTQPVVSLEDEKKHYAPHVLIGKRNWAAVMSTYIIALWCTSFEKSKVGPAHLLEKDLRFYWSLPRSCYMWSHLRWLWSKLSWMSLVTSCISRLMGQDVYNSCKTRVTQGVLRLPFTPRRPQD